LPSFAVNDSALSDFGMSVQTNAEVSWAGPVEWMRISAVAPGSAAARADLLPGDRILAIDGILITKLEKTQMLDLLFHRRPGASSRMLILGQHGPLPRFVTLVARRPLY
jgi:C-terminal processing protease CtpA/Prc